MTGLITAGKVPVSLLLWKIMNLTKVYAGNGCVMAIDREGKALCRTAPGLEREDLDDWIQIQSISVSQHVPGLAVGLTRDGTCLVTGKALKRFCETTGASFRSAVATIASWRNIVQVQVSDAVFALDRWGRVHCVSLTRGTDYSSLDQWRPVRRIVTGNQDAIFGITADGRVLCAGHNCLRGPRGDMTETLAALERVSDICAIGSECGRVIVACADGSLRDVFSGETLNGAHRGAPAFVSNYCLAAVMEKENRVDFVEQFFPKPEALEALRGIRLQSVAVGHHDGEPFVVAIRE